MLSLNLPEKASPEQQRLFAWRTGVRQWADTVLRDYDRTESMILLLSDGDPEKLRRFTYKCTHTEIAEAYLARLLSNG